MSQKGFGRGKIIGKTHTAGVFLAQRKKVKGVPHNATWFLSIGCLSAPDPLIDKGLRLPSHNHSSL